MRDKIELGRWRPRRAASRAGQRDLEIEVAAASLVKAAGATTAPIARS